MSRITAKSLELPTAGTWNEPYINLLGDEVYLDGHFTAEQLRKIADTMDSDDNSDNQPQ